MILLALKGPVSVRILSTKVYYFDVYYGSGRNDIFPRYSNHSLGYMDLDHFDMLSSLVLYVKSHIIHNYSFKVLWCVPS